MKTFLVAILILTALSVIALFLNDYIVKRKYRRFVNKKYKVIQRLSRKIEANEPVGAAEIMTLVRQPAIRQAVFQVLNIYNRTDLFPADYLTFEKGAESYLATWLEYPTELGRVPDEIKLLTKIFLDDGMSRYYVFGYKSKEPRWASKLNWMMGVAGPYSPTSLPYDVPKRIFSRFNTVDSISAEDEVRWVHENINR